MQVGLTVSEGANERANEGANVCGSCHHIVAEVSLHMLNVIERTQLHPIASSRF